MSETPIGSIEFLVKFDTIGKEFTDALKDAIDKSDIDVGIPDDIKRDIQSIKYNIESRLRGTFSRDRLQFLSTAVPEMGAAKGEKFVGELAGILMGSKTGKRIFGQKDGEEGEAYKERMIITAKKISDSYAKVIEDAMEDPELYSRDIGKIINLQGAFQQAMKGNWQYMTEKIIDQLLKEEDWETLTRERLKAAGVDVMKGQRRWQFTEEKVGTGKTLIDTTDKLIKRIEEMGLSKEKGAEIFFGVKAVTGIGDQLVKFFETYTIKKGLPVPRPILKAGEAAGALSMEEWTQKGAGMQPDIPMLISRESWKVNKQTILSFFDSPAMQETFAALVDGSLEKSQFAAFMMEGKVVLSYAKHLDKVFRQYAVEKGIFSGVGGKTPGLTITGHEAIREVTFKTQEELVNLKFDELIEQGKVAAEQTSIVIGMLEAQGRTEEAAELRSLQVRKEK